MKARRASWTDVQPGDYVKDLNGKTWKVQHWDHVRAILQDRDGKTSRVSPRPHSPVTILSVSAEEAVSLIAEKLGGVVIEDERTPL